MKNYPPLKRIRYWLGSRLLAPHLDALYQEYSNQLEEAQGRSDVLIGIRFGLAAALRAKPETRRPMGTLPPL